MLPLAIANPFGGESWYVDDCASTMALAKELADRGSPSGSLVAAGRQTAGRGRVAGRSWRDEAGKSLLFTIMLRRGEFPEAGIALRAGLAVARAVEDAAGIRCELKWPNDLLAGGRKLAGILCEGDARSLRIGIGVNCLQESFPEEIARKAGSLLIASGRRVEPLDLLPLALARLMGALRDDRWRGAVEERLWLRGERLRFKIGDPGAADIVEGVLRGIGPAGELLIEGADGVRGFHSGEIIRDQEYPDEHRWTPRGRGE